jgi:hypothetical protein
MQQHDIILLYNCRTNYLPDTDGYEVLLRVGTHSFTVVADLPFKATMKAYKEVISSFTEIQNQSRQSRTGVLDPVGSASTMPTPIRICNLFNRV